MGQLSGLKSHCPSTKNECEEGVEFVTKVNAILDALLDNYTPRAENGISVSHILRLIYLQI